MEQMIKVSVVDDHILLRNALSVLINNTGMCKVLFEANNGKELIEKINHGIIPDVLILDLYMPVMDGFTASIKIREFNEHTPIITLTATASEDIKDKLHEVGMQDYVIKPFDIDVLFSKMQRLLK